MMTICRLVGGGGSRRLFLNGQFFTIRSLLDDEFRQPEINTNEQEEEEEEEEEDEAASVVDGRIALCLLFRVGRVGC